MGSEWLATILPVPPMLLRVLRVVRVLRILRLLKGAKELRTLIMTMIYAFPSLINVCGRATRTVPHRSQWTQCPTDPSGFSAQCTTRAVALCVPQVCGVLALIIFIYAILGVDFFTFVAHQQNINDYRNFDDLGHAGLLLFQCLTGDAWSALMTDAMVADGAGCSEGAGDCGSWIAIPYFISFQVCPPPRV